MLAVLGDLFIMYGKMSFIAGSFIHRGNSIFDVLNLNMDVELWGSK